MPIPLPPSTTKDPYRRLKELVERYTTLITVPNLEEYRRITTKKEGSCVFRGCTEPIAWENAQGGNFLCEGHFQTMKLWIEEARKGYFVR